MPKARSPRTPVKRMPKPRNIAEKDFVFSSSHLDTALNFSVFRCEVRRNPDIDNIVDVPVVMQRQVPTIRTVQRTVEVEQVQFLDRVPVVIEG